MEMVQPLLNIIILKNRNLAIVFNLNFLKFNYKMDSRIGNLISNNNNKKKIKDIIMIYIQLKRKV